MGKIYQQAALVLTWLGEQSQDSNQAINFINGRLRSQSEHHMALKWEAINSLFHREYWQRTWIIQEIQLAKDVLFPDGNVFSSQPSFSRGQRRLY